MTWDGAAVVGAAGLAGTGIGWLFRLQRTVDANKADAKVANTETNARVSVVEARVDGIKADVSEIKADVKAILGRM